MMIIRVAGLAAVMAAGCTPVAAGDIAGHYRMEGVSTTGSAYSGTADITMSFENTCRIRYSDGFEGICMLSGDRTVTAAYIVHGKAGLAIYEAQSDGSLVGTFIDDFHGGKFGKEKLTPLR